MSALTTTELLRLYSYTSTPKLVILPGFMHHRSCPGPVTPSSLHFLPHHILILLHSNPRGFNLTISQSLVGSLSRSHRVLLCQVAELEGDVCKLWVQGLAT